MEDSKIKEFLNIYGIKTDLNLVKDKKYIRVTNIRDFRFPFKYQSIGLRLFRINNKKITTYGAQFFWKQLKNKIELTKEEVEGFLKGENLKKEVSRGYVILSYKGFVVGIGYSNGKIILNNLPKSLKRENVIIEW